MNAHQQVTENSIIQAVQVGNFEFVQDYIVKFSPFILDNFKCSLFHWAAINNRVNIMNFLIDQLINLQKNEMKYDNNLLLNIINKSGGDLNEIPLQWAVRNHNNIYMVKLLLSIGSNLFHKNIYGNDALFIAVESNSLHIVYMLLNNGADVNTTNNDGNTPLNWLLLNHARNSIEMQRLLLKFHANTSNLKLYNGDGNYLHHLISLTSSEKRPKIDFNSLFEIIQCNEGKLIEGKY
jgi:ankyrin repeat protein